MSDLKSADEIIEEYSKPYSSIDNGNLYFACCTYQTEYKKLQTELAQLREKCAEYEKCLIFYYNRAMLIAAEDKTPEQCQNNYAGFYAGEVLEKWKGKGLR